MLTTTLALLLAAAAPQPRVHITQVPAAAAGRSCAAYLAVPQKPPRDLPVVLAMAGTGIYSNARSAAEDPIAVSLLAQRKAAWLTFDKPGITAPSRGRRPVVDDATYNRYTPADLEACAGHALAWAAGLVKGRGAVVLQGHSEGALVAARTLLALHEAKSPLAGRITALVLAGTPGTDMREIVDAQYASAEKRQAMHAALEAGDDAALRAHGGTGAGSLRALLALPPLTDTFEALARARVRTRVALFHGRDDRAVPPASAERLLVENQRRIDDARPALDLSLRLYPAGHGLDLGAVHDMALWIADALTPAGHLAIAPRVDEGELAADISDGAAETLAGVYRVDEGMTLEITREDGRLWAQVTGQPRFRIYPSSEQRFFARVAPISFEPEREGDRVVAVTLIQGEPLRCPRVR